MSATVGGTSVRDVSFELAAERFSVSPAFPVMGNMRWRRRSPDWRRLPTVTSSSAGSASPVVVKRGRSPTTSATCRSVRSTMPQLLASTSASISRCGGCADCRCFAPARNRRQRRRTDRALRRAAARRQALRLRFVRRQFAKTGRRTGAFRAHRLVVASYPTMGLDVLATQAVYRSLFVQAPAAPVSSGYRRNWTISWPMRTGSR